MIRLCLTTILNPSVLKKAGPVVKLIGAVRLPLTFTSHCESPKKIASYLRQCYCLNSEKKQRK